MLSVGFRLEVDEGIVRIVQSIMSLQFLVRS